MTSLRASHAFRASLLVISAVTALGGCSDDEAVAPAPTGPLTIEVAPGCNPLGRGDSCMHPLPSSFFEVEADTPTGVQLAYPEGGLQEPPGTKAIKLDRFNMADGASPTMPILVSLGVDVDPAQLIGQRDIERSLEEDNLIVLYDVETGARIPAVTEMDPNGAGDPDSVGRQALIVRPMVPMELGHRHAVALRAGLMDTSGAPIASTPGFAALRDALPTTNAAIEDKRAAFEELFAFLDGEGIARAELVLAWDFTVASEEHVLGPILSMRERALAEVDTNGHSYTITGIVADPNPDTALLVEGDYDVPCFLNEDNEIERGDDGLPVLQGSCSFPFTVIVPAVAKTTGGLDLTLFGHGIFGNGRDYLTGDIGTGFLQPIAQEGGSVVIATDWIGLSDGDLDLIIEEVVADLNRLPIVTDRLQQSLINNLVLLDLALDELQHDPQLALGPAEDLLNGERVHYYGVSLGGIQGSSLVSLSRDIERAVVAVPGSSWSTMLMRSVVYQPIKGFVDLSYPDPLTQLTFVSLMQSQFDYSDPINLTRLAFEAPLSDAPPNRRIVLQEAIGDCQVPNIVTGMLARRLGAQLLGPAHEPVFDVEETTTPDEDAVLVQFVLPPALDDYAPPDEAVVPEKDNGVHSGSVVLSSAIAQVKQFLQTGEIINPCDGVCDPD